jgi:Bacterial SH3 domain
MAVSARFGIPGLLLAIAAVLCALPSVSRADGYRVVDVAGSDSLNVRAGPSASFPVVGTFPPDARGVRVMRPCLVNWCRVSRGSVIGWANMRFLAPDTEPEAPAATMPEPTRTVLPDGTLELRFVDGTRRHMLPDGQLEVVHPDGSKSKFAFVQTPGADLPPLPSEFSGWATRVNDDLLGILTNILTPDEFTAYKQTEAGKDFYGVLSWRLRSIQFLTAPVS